MLTGICLEFDDDSDVGDEDQYLSVSFGGDCPQDRRQFWMEYPRGRAMLEHFARVCLESQLRQFQEAQKEPSTKLKAV